LDSEIGNLMILHRAREQRAHTISRVTSEEEIRFQATRFLSVCVCVCVCVCQINYSGLCNWLPKTIGLRIKQHGDLHCNAFS